MKTSKFLLSTLVAAAAMTANVYADTPVSTTIDEALANATTNNQYFASSAKVLLWVGDATGGAMTTAENWVVGTVADNVITWGTTNEAPTSAQGNTSGTLMVVGAGYENASLTISESCNTSDGGGIVVSGTNNTVTVTMGTWAGSVQVDAGNTLYTSWSNLKEGTIIANGTVNISSNLTFDRDHERTWFVGAEGAINFTSTSALALSQGSIAVSGVIDNTSDTAASLDGLTNRKLGVGVASKQLLSFAGGLASGVDSISVGSISAENGSKLTSVSTLSGLTAANQYYAEKSSSGVTVYYTAEGQIVKESLIWTGTSENSTWTEFGTNWNDANGTATSFVSGDDVTFDSTAESKTVSLASGVAVRVANMTVSDDYTFVVDSDSASISGNTLSVASGATLTVGNTDTKTVNLGFSEISVAGTLAYNNGVGSWSSLTLKNGSRLHIEDLVFSDSVTGLTIGSTKVEGNSAITATWDGSVNLGVVSGSGDLSVSGSERGSVTVAIGGLRDYTGTLTLSKNNGLAVNITGNGMSETEMYTKELGNSSLDIVLGEGTSLNLTDAFGKLTYNTMTMKDGAALTFTNGNSWGPADSRDIKGALFVDAEGGSVTIQGSNYGNSSDIAGTVSGVGTINFGSLTGNSYTVSADISDKSDAEKLAIVVGLNSSASLNVSGNNTYSGGTTINSGKVVITNESALGTGTVSIATDAGLELGSDLTVGGLEGESGAKITATVGGFTLEVAGGGTFAGSIAPAGLEVNLVKSGANDSVLTITGTRVNGDTTILSGTLVAASETALGTGDVTVDGGVLSVGDGVVIDNSVTLMLDALYQENPAIIGDGEYSGAVTVDGTWDEALLSGLVTVAEEIAQSTFVFQIFGGDLATTDATVSLSDELAAALSDSGFEYNIDSGILTITSIPEPSAFGLLAGLGAITLAVSRRKRRA